MARAGALRAGADPATFRALEHTETSVETARVLVVDDEDIVREVLVRYLEKDGFRVETAANGEEAVEAAATFSPDIVVLDVMLPKLDGLEVLRKLRETSEVPVVMLTAKREEVDRVVGLELGADDYVSKPFSPREVVARIRAILRRLDRRSADGSRSIVAGTLEIDRDRREVRRSGAVVALTRKEFDLLEALATHPGRTFTRTELLEDIWDFAWDGDSSTVTVHVRRLRSKIEDDPSVPRHVVTVWGVGYRFEP